MSVLGRLRAASGLIGRTRAFDWRRAQAYEISSARNFIANNYERLRLEIEAAHASPFELTASSLVANEFFEGNAAAWSSFARELEGRTVLEVGAGPFPQVLFWPWTGRKVVIDPLFADYRNVQIELFGESLVGPEVDGRSDRGEVVQPDLVGAIDGLVVCRNALDHCDEPYAVLDNLGVYAKPGCYLMLWTDLWHLEGRDDGHSNVTKDVGEFEARVLNAGFEVIRRSPPVRAAGVAIEYGCLARKTQ